MIGIIENTKSRVLISPFAYYKMEGNTNDEKGVYNAQGIDLTYMEGLILKTAVLNGNTAKIVTPVNINYFYIEDGVEYSIFCTFNPSRFDTRDRIIYGYGGGAGEGANLALFVTTAGELKIWLRGGLTSLGFVSLDTWYSSCLYVKNNVAKINVDGVVTTLNIGTSAIQDTYPDGLVFGCTSNTSSSNYFGGKIDDSGVYNVGLTDAEADGVVAKLKSGKPLTL